MHSIVQVHICNVCKSNHLTLNIVGYKQLYVKILEVHNHNILDEKEHHIFHNILFYCNLQKLFPSRLNNISNHNQCGSGSK